MLKVAVRPYATTRTLWHLLALTTIGWYLAPYFRLGEGVHVTIFDQLDSMFIDNRVLSLSGQILASPNAIVANLAGGIPRAFLPSPLYIPVWLTDICGPFTAFVANQVIIRLAAYVGMHRLLTRHVMTDADSLVPATLASVAFALLPFYSLFGLSVAGQPLIASAFLTVRRGDATWRDWGIICGIPFYSVAAFSGVFTACLVGGVWLFDLLRRHSGTTRLAAAIGAFVIVSAIVDYQLIISLFNGTVVSHRVEIKPVVPTVAAAYDSGFLNFLYGQEHVPSLQRKIILPAVLFALVLLSFRTGRQRYQTTQARWKGAAAIGAALVLTAAAIYLYFHENSPTWLALLETMYTDRQLLTPAAKLRSAGVDVLLLAIFGVLATQAAGADKRRFSLILQFMIVTMLVSMWYGFWPRIWASATASWPHLTYANLSRFHYFHPTLWGILLALALSVVWKNITWLGKPIAVAITCLQLVVLVNASEDRVEQTAGRPTYRAFFSQALFNDVATYIGKDRHSYHVASLGLFSSVASFNGFLTLDGYSQSYPLAHKQRFRSIIAGELAADPVYRSYFDDWGSRYYIFSREIRAQAESVAFLLTKDAVARLGVKVDDLRIDVNAFRAMDGQYLFSAVDIGNAAQLGLTLLRTFEHPDSPWKIFLYSATRTSGAGTQR